MVGTSVGPECDPPETNDNDDLESIYQSVCEERELGHRPVLQNTQRLKQHDELFYENVTLGGKVSVSAMLDSGSMACTLSSSVIPQLLEQAVLETTTLEPTDIVLIGCGGSKTIPSGVCDLDVEIYGCRVVVPTLVVDGQSDKLIIGSNLLRYLGHRLKLERGLMDYGLRTHSTECGPQKQLLSLMAGVEECTEDVTDRVGIVKIKSCHSGAYD